MFVPLTIWWQRWRADQSFFFFRRVFCLHKHKLFLSLGSFRGCFAKAVRQVDREELPRTYLLIHAEYVSKRIQTPLRKMYYSF